MQEYQTLTENDFHKARNRARIITLLSKLQMKRTDLLSFYDIKDLIKPRRETYIGLKPIPVDKIIGSEGRYLDFNLAFLPKKEMLKGRWQSIDRARLEMVTLPPIQVYKIGETYFVRDGNHRVSVAKAQGVAFIDAEIVELSSQINLEPGMTDWQIEKSVIEYERQRCLDETHLDTIIDMDSISFTSPGRYPEMLHHINVHKYYINMDKTREISFAEAAKSWYEHVYMPIYTTIEHQHMLSKFPGRTPGDLYIWLVKHWDELKDEKGDGVSIAEASSDYLSKNKPGLLRRVRDRLRILVHGRKG